MGQRSQIYFRVNTLDGKYILVAQYFHWNYGTRMISRARGLLQWLENNKDYPTMFYKSSEQLTKVQRIMEINWDYHDIVLSQDIIKEYEEGLYSKSKEMFTGQDCNDGQFIIDMVIDWKRQNKKGDYPVKFKYAFLDTTSDLIGNGEAYMDWESEHLIKPWRELYMDELKYTERNIRYLDKHATLMTKEDIKEYINHDYAKDMGLEDKNDKQTAD